LQKVVLIFISGLLLSGCSVFKRRSENINYSENSAGLVEATISNNLSERNFYISKAEVTAGSGGISTKFLASIKYIKPDTILLSLKAIIGTEVARAFMTKDTLMINDRINKILYTGKPGVRTLKYGIEPDMLFVILGDLVLSDSLKNENPVCNKGYSKVRGRLNQKEIEYDIDCSKKKVAETRIAEDIFSGEINIKVRKTSNVSGVIIPERIEVQDVENEFDLDIKIDRIETEWSGKIQFLPGRNYKVKIIR
jgi:hypothetical protein